MVIERALERMRRESAAKAAEQHSGSVAGASERLAVSPAAPSAPRPVFPHLEVDVRIAEQSRVFVPKAGTGKDSRAHAAYRMLRTRLLQAMRQNHWTKIAITSPGAGEGKSVTSLNLALSLARDKSSSVFLLDLDLRNPSVCGYLGVRPVCDLVRYFNGTGDPASVFFSIGAENLAIAGSRQSTDQASELLASPKLQELLEYPARIASPPIVLIDLPPLLVTDEALLIAPRVDATLLVVSEGISRRDSLARARHLLADFMVAGVVLNRTSESFGADSDYDYRHRYTESNR